MPCRETDLGCVGAFPYLEAPVRVQGPLDLRPPIRLPSALWPSCHLPSPRTWSLGPSLRIPFQVSRPPSEGCLGKTAKSKGSLLEDLGAARAPQGFCSVGPLLGGSGLLHSDPLQHCQGCAPSPFSYSHNPPWTSAPRAVHAADI